MVLINRQWIHFNKKPLCLTKHLTFNLITKLHLFPFQILQLWLTSWATPVPSCTWRLPCPTVGTIWNECATTRADISSVSTRTGSRTSWRKNRPSQTFGAAATCAMTVLVTIKNCNSPILRYCFPKIWIYISSQMIQKYNMKKLQNMNKL